MVLRAHRVPGMVNEDVSSTGQVLRMATVGGAATTPYGHGSCGHEGTSRRCGHHRPRVAVAVEILLGDDRAREVDDPLTAAMPPLGTLNQEPAHDADHVGLESR